MGKVPFHVSVAACAVAMIPSAGHAATDADIEALRAELARVKAEYAERINRLEAQVAQLTPEADVGATAAVDQAVAAAPPVPAPATNSPSAFNPAISLILAGNYSNLSQNPEDYAIQGFIPAGDEIGPGDRSFNLGETELTIAANIDPYFMGSMTAAITPENEIEIEEAYFRTLALPLGLTVKGGQFFSSIGYLNEIHAHAWDFTDQPLVYQAFLGGQMAVQGLQTKWIAPLDVLVEFGVETGNGDYYPGTRLSRNGLNGVNAYGHVGGDIGDSVAWRTGLSYVYLDAQDYEYDDLNAAGEDVTNVFNGTTRMWIADAELKWTPIGDTKRRYLKLQGEFMQRDQDGDLGYVDSVGELDGSYDTDQYGWYVQGVFQFLPRWRFGARYDYLDSGDTDIGLVQDGTLSADDFSILLPGTPKRTTVMFDWSPSEFSRLRAQYAWDEASRDRPTSSSSCSTSMHSARMAPTSSREHSHDDPQAHDLLRDVPAGRRDARACRNPHPCHHRRLGRARHRARRRQGQRLYRDERAAGRAPGERQAEPGRTGPHGRPRGRQRRRPRGRLAAGAALGVRQPEDPAGHARLLRGGGLREAARRVRHRGPFAGRRAPQRQSAHPARPAQHRAWSHGRSPRGLRPSIPPTRRTTSRVARTSRPAGARRSRAGPPRGRSSGACRSSRYTPTSATCSTGSAWRRSRRSSPSPACRRARATLRGSSRSSPPTSRR